MKQELKTVARYSDQMSADFAAGLLNANGIRPKCSVRLLLILLSMLPSTALR